MTQLLSLYIKNNSETHLQEMHDNTSPVGNVVQLLEALPREPGVVVLTCDPGTLGYGGRRIRSSEAAMATVVSLRPVGISETL